MNINKTNEGEKTILTLEGRLDTTTAPQLQVALIPEFDDAKEIELDIKALEYVSSAGLRVFLMGAKASKAKNVVFTVSHVSEEILEVFDMTGFSEILTIV
jgi:anti-sigma B factor antagonist